MQGWPLCLCQVPKGQDLDNHTSSALDAGGTMESWTELEKGKKQQIWAPAFTSLVLDCRCKVPAILCPCSSIPQHDGQNSRSVSQNKLFLNCFYWVLWHSNQKGNQYSVLQCEPVALVALGNRSLSCFQGVLALTRQILSFFLESF